MAEKQIANYTHIDKRTGIANVDYCKFRNEIWFLKFLMFLRIASDFHKNMQK